MKIIKEIDWETRIDGTGLTRGFLADDDKTYKFFFSFEPELAKLPKAELKALADAEYEAWKEKILK